MKLPTYDEIVEKLEAGAAPQDLTALERFIYYYDAADPEQSAIFMQNLRQVIEETRKEMTL